MTSQGLVSLFVFTSCISLLACGGSIESGAVLVDSDGEGDGDRSGGSRQARSGEHPGCTTNETPQREYENTAELGELLAGRWRSCQPDDDAGYGFNGEEAGVEFTADGGWFSLSELDGEIVRNGISGSWQFIPPDSFMIDELGTNAPFITADPKSATIGIDPRFPRYVPLED